MTSQVDPRVVPVGFIEVESDAFNCFRSIQTKTCSKPGAEAEIVQLVFAILNNISWQVVDVEQEFGIFPELGSRINDSAEWTGMMGLLVAEKVLMSGISMHVTPDRMKDVLFAFPLRYFQTIYVVKKPTETYSTNLILNAFPVTFLSVMLATFLIIWVFHVLYALLFKPQHVPFKTAFFKQSGTSLMKLCSANLRQTLPMQSTGALFALNFCYMLCMIVILNYYQTTIFSNLVSPNYYQIPFRNRKELAEALLKKRVFMTDIKRSRPYCAYDCQELYAALDKNPMRVRDKDSQVFQDIEEDGVYQSKLDTNFLPSEFNWFSRRYDKIIIKDNREVTHYTAFAFSKSQRRLRRRFDQALIEVLPAVAHITTAHGYRTKRQPFNQIEERHFFGLSINAHFMQVFYIYFIGMALSLIVFGLEVIIFHVRD